MTAAEKVNDGLWPDEQAMQEAGEWHERYQELSAADLGIDSTQLGQAGSPTWVASVEPDQYARAGRVINESDPALAIDLLLTDLQERGLLTFTDTAQTSPSSTHAPVTTRQGAPLPGKAVWVVAELAPRGVRKITLELLGKGQALAAQLQSELAALLIGRPAVQHPSPTLPPPAPQKFHP